MIRRCLSLIFLAAVAIVGGAQDKPLDRAEKVRLIEVRSGFTAELKMSGGLEIHEVLASDGKVLIRPKGEGNKAFTDHLGIFWTKDEKLIVYGVVPGTSRLTLVSKDGTAEALEVLVFLQMFVPLETKKPREAEFLSPIQSIELANEKTLRVHVKKNNPKVAVVQPIQPGNFRFVVVNQDRSRMTMEVQVRSLAAPAKDTIIVSEKETIVYQMRDAAIIKMATADDDAIRLSHAGDAKKLLITGLREGLTRIKITSIDNKAEEHEVIVRAAKE